MEKPNHEIRQFIKGSNVFNWQVAQQLQIGDNTFYTMLRRQLTAEEKNQIIEAVEAVKQRNSLIKEHRNV